MADRDRELWDEVATKMDSTISDLNQGVQFGSFHPITLHTLYLLTSICYYNFHSSFMPDPLFDKLCVYMLEHYEEFKAVVRHPEKTLSKESLHAGTGFDIEFPNTIWKLAEAFLRLRKKSDRYYSNVWAGNKPDKVLPVKPVIKPVKKKKSDLAFW